MPAAAARALTSLASVCFTGYVMDTFCLDRGTMLDNSKLRSLEYPDRHSVHCLVDVAVCRESGFEVLKDPDQEGGLYCRQFKLDGPGNDAALALARKEGSRSAGCTTCEGTGTLERGFRATVWGELDEENPKVLRTVSVLSASVGCPADHTNPPLPPVNCGADGGLLDEQIKHGSLMIASWGFLLPAGSHSQRRHPGRARRRAVPRAQACSSPTSSAGRPRSGSASTRPSRSAACASPSSAGQSP